MGYDVHITRADSWLDSEEHPITLEAWLAYAHSDPEMRIDGRAQAQTLEGEVLVMDSVGLAVWTSYSGHARDGNHAWFALQEGCVVVKNPDPEILRKMWLVAQLLNARVQGDDGENYGPDGNRLGNSPRPPWWRRFLNK